MNKFGSNALKFHFRTSRQSTLFVFTASFLLCECWATAAGIGGEPDSVLLADDKISFARQVLPILSDKCFACHGPDTKDDMLRLDSAEFAMADRGGYHAIDSNAPDKSELLKRIHDADDPMPPQDAERQLTDRERQILSRWIEQGGEYQRHWAFLRPEKTSPPDVEDGSVNGVIDRFIFAELKTRNATPAPAAERSVLARRVALTLTGLPPEPDLLKAFLNDNDDGAYDRVVEQLMSLPRYGEHQARFWLDAVRYGDTHGLHLDNRRGIFPYRDWVIFALNQNLPLDDFIIWQLAGDLLPSPTMEQMVATGFVRMNPSTSEGGVIPEEFQAKNTFDRTETLGTVFLGLTLTCARCHTHKYDPITHREYYELFAFFNSTQEKPLDGNKYDYAPTVKAPRDLDGWQRWSELSEQREQRLREVVKQMEALRSAIAKVPGQLPETADQQEALLLQLNRPLAQLQSQLKAVEDFQENLTTTLVAGELETPRPTHVLTRGEYDQPQAESLQPGIPAALGSLPSAAPANRLGLAQWLISRDNPLVARVLVNRLWQQVFGYGLVRTPEDFGLQGEQPTHPELLDWLAVELQESGWDLKHMLRLMVQSKTFRQSSKWRTDIDDPENRLFARGPSYRLDAEVLRDMGLWASELLDQNMGGEGVKPYQPDGMWAALAHPASNTKKYEKDSGEKLFRRSIYVYWKRTSPHPMMTLFDAPSRESSCVRRSRTNTSLQSLGLLNETQRVEMARRFAENLVSGAATDAERLEILFERLACRRPQGNEIDASQRLLETMRARFTAAPQDARSLLAIGDLPPKPELDPVEIAAWTQLAATVLASDASIMLY